MRIGKPSPAMVVALLALMVALGGSAYAVSQINGSQIKNRTIKARKIVKDTLTGTEIRESKLGIVPQAQHANVATGAITLDGLPASAFSQLKTYSNELTIANDDIQRDVLAIPGVGTIEGTCNNGGAGDFVMSNGTGQTVSVTTDHPGGASVAPNAVLFSDLNAQIANLHVVLAWEDGATKRFADITVGNFKDGAVCHYVAMAEVG